MGCGGSKASADGVRTSGVVLKKGSGPSAATASASATKLQSRVRGKAARERVENMRHPCMNYRVNMKAEEFGTCMCGWPKKDHTPEALAKKATEHKSPKKIVSDNVLRDRMMDSPLRSGKCACERYQVNMQAVEFGQCVCGEPKANHSAAALAAGEATKVAKVDDAEVRARMVQRQKADCLRYEVAMGESGFGTCVCGRPRAEHSEAALAAGASKGGSPKRVEVRKTFAKTAAWCDRETIECAHYVVDLDPDVPFGQCKNCGFPKAKHADAALFVGRPRAETAP